MTTNTISIRADAIKAKAIKAYPGDTRMMLTRNVTTCDGDLIKRGTIFQPQSGGMDAGLGFAVRRVAVITR